MTHHRTIQTIALVLAMCSIVGAALLSNPIVDQRKTMIVDDENRSAAMDDRLPPSISLLTAAGGPLRALVVNALWYRLEELKQAGLYYESHTLSTWLSHLMPRSAKVWDFHSWNMAYNISVAVHTPEERWDWVSKGVHILRDKGIPLNPKAVYLYKQMSWIMFHKIGKDSDDMHWYYKREFVSDFHELLESTPPSTPTEQVIEEFRTIVDSPDRLSDLIEQTPSVEGLLAAFADLDLNANQELARSIARVRMFRDSPLVQIFAKDDEQQAKMTQFYDVRIAAVLDDENHADAIEPLLAFLRRKALIDDYHMDPHFMLTVMEKHGPLDWRHPMSHGLYFAELGVKQAGGLKTSRNVDLLNTLRNTVHNLQEIAWQGVILYDPVEFKLRKNYVPMFQPDPRIIDSYDKQISASRVRLQAEHEKDPKKYKKGAVDNFKMGHENFLHAAVRDHYLYGSREKAEFYMNKLRTEFYDISQNEENKKMYESKTLEEFIEINLRRELSGRTQITSFITPMVAQAIMQGLAQGRMEVFDRFMSLARQAWDVQKATADKTVGAIQDRRGLQPFHEWVEATIIQFLLDPKRAPTTRARVWHNMPIELQLAVFDRVAIPLKKQMDSISFDFDRAFPTPEGIEQHREKIKKEVKEREESEEEDKSRRGKGN